MNPTLFDEPVARFADPVTSREAASVVRRGNQELITAIRWWVSKQSEPVSAFQIARAICGNRWQSDTVRSAVSRASLTAVDSNGVTDAGRRCLRYSL